MPIDLSRVKAICFDIDGTLSNTDDQFVQNFARILSPVGFLFRIEDILPVSRKLVMFSEGPGNWVYSMADKLGVDNWLTSLDDFLYEHGVGKSPEPYTLIDGTREMLAILRDKFPLSIISARGQKAAYRFLFQFELAHFFTAVATCDTCLHTKPYPEPIHWVAERMGVPTSACLMVGDTVVDILAGKNAGTQTVGVLCGFGEEKELKQAGADLVLANTTDLLEILR